MVPKRPWAFIFMNDASVVEKDQMELVQVCGSRLLVYGSVRSLRPVLW
jgi:hypothetical protein